MINSIKEKSKLEIASLTLFSLNALFYVLFLISIFLVNSAGLGLPFRLFTPIIALLGIITGLIAFIIERNWIGLLLNFIFVFLIVAFSWIYHACCASTN